MEGIEIGESAPSLNTSDYNGIYINGIKCKYSITKSEKEKDSLIIKLFDPTNQSNSYYSYESSYEHIIKDIKFLSMYENIDEILYLSEYSPPNIRPKEPLYNDYTLNKRLIN